ncbi:outer membrane protein assembly factor BamD [Sphingomonas sabuli]|uniref:Outer membrane protein assembly factor BamD n=1 Tax=Sphingomonas sabuli TaxID=2764186 RepID=A0A7G9L5G5_9SPHN|nr:outer membrane protein assembly factor BamD [Sphingomonas sabuli]QNM83864.1 outer membrane protein assembly factor BamD [Sphingomonas sabuli]
MSKLTRIAATVLAAALIAPLAGCGGKKNANDVGYVARDVNTLYDLGKKNLEKGDYEMAGKLFAEVERQHPYSPWARKAQLMSAFSYYISNKYSDAISTAQRYLTIHTGSRDAPYAHYLIGMSYYEQITDVTRDQRTTQQALDAFGELTRRYPTSRYTSDARLKMDLLNDHLAGKEMEIGRYYERSGKWLAANLRFRKVVANYQTTSHTPEALQRLVETYLALGIPAEAYKSAAVLGSNYPGSEWYDRAYKLIQRHASNVQPAAAPAPAPAPAPQVQALPPTQPAPMPPQEPDELAPQPQTQPQG